MFSVVLASSLSLVALNHILMFHVFVSSLTSMVIYLCSHPWFHQDQWIQGVVLWVGGQKKASGIQDLVDELIDFPLTM